MHTFIQFCATNLGQAGKTTAITRVAVREAGVSGDYGCRIEDSPETPRTITSTIAFGGLRGPSIGPPNVFFCSLAIRIDIYMKIIMHIFIPIYLYSYV